MIVIPDLFGSYQKGREAAIDANWKDLQNYENVESARHQNDAAALANLATMADFGVRRRMVQNEGTNSDLTTELNQVSQIGKLANAYTNNTLGLVNNNIIQSNIPYLTTIGSTGLQTYGNNILTNNNNSVTNLLNSDVLRGVTEITHPETFNSAVNTQRAKIATANTAAKYSPTIAELQYQKGVVDGRTAFKQSQNNYVVTDITSGYIAEQAHLDNQLKTLTLVNGILQGKVTDKTLKHELNQLDYKQQYAVLSSALSLAEQANAPEKVAEIRQEMSRVLANQYNVVGGKGSIPIINPATGQQIGTANPDGTVSRTADTGTSSTSAGNTARGVTATTPTAVTSNNLFGMPQFTQYRPVATVNVVRPMGGQGGPLIKVPVYNQGSRNPTATDYASWWGAY